MSSNAIKNKLFSKAFWKSRNGQLTFCVAGGAFSILFLLIQFGAFSGGLLPNAAAEERLEKELKKLQQTQKELESDLAVQEEVRKQAAAKFNGAWKNSVHGVPEVELRSMLEIPPAIWICGTTSSVWSKKSVSIRTLLCLKLMWI